MSSKHSGIGFTQKEKNEVTVTIEGMQDSESESKGEWNSDDGLMNKHTKRLTN